MKTIDNIVIVGFGSIAQALIPLLVERYECKITIFEKDIDSEKEKIASEFKAIIVNRTIT
ncbi:Homospermidine synthase [Pseudomonas coronafaciens pv. atropurpurea]|nr:Homospermidine synthase [Pseudomonas coronafaciens pv. atropurpurea]